VQAVIEGIRDRVLDAARLRPEMILADIGAGDSLVAFGAIARMNNVFACASYRFNLEGGPKIRHDIQAAGGTDPHDHTLSLGTFYMYGNSVQRIRGVDTLLTNREPYYRVGGDFSDARATGEGAIGRPFAHTSV